MDRETIGIYDRMATAYANSRQPKRKTDARRFGRSVPTGTPRLDLGCGPGRYTPDLGTPTVALDAAPAMVALATTKASNAGGMVADLTALPLRSASVGGAWASMTYHHLPREDVPLALADLHRVLTVGAPIDITTVAGDYVGTALPHDDFPGRFFACWPPDALADVVTGAGFDVEHIGVIEERNAHVRARRARSLADTVGPGMRLLVCGLNPSLYAADAGVGYARPGNRFWPAALATGLVSRDRDATHALRHHRIGLTDLCKRATARADELTSAEYSAGAARVERLVGWLQPGAICFVGLGGYRAAVDANAAPGPQPRPFGGVPAYVMPSTSGANAHASLADLIAHLKAAAG